MLDADGQHGGTARLVGQADALLRALGRPQRHPARAEHVRDRRAVTAGLGAAGVLTVAIGFASQTVENVRVLIDKTTEDLTLAVSQQGYAFARVRPQPQADPAADRPLPSKAQPAGSALPANDPEAPLIAAE